MEKRTALYEKHLAAGGKMVPFAGFLMPVQYPAGVIAEHMAVREAVGLFDVSHMGEIILAGSGAGCFVQYLLANDMANLAVGSCRYSPLCNEQGGFVDDLIVYRRGEEDYLLVVNASNRAKVKDFIKGRLPADVLFKDESDATALLALQGPKAEVVLSKVVQAGSLPQKNYTFKNNVNVAGITCLVSRTGYTGEDGFELYCSAKNVPVLWDALLEAGQEAGLIPCGLGARDTLRLEAAMPLYGHEMDEEITPFEAGLGFFVKMGKPDFIGKAALAQKINPRRRRTGLKMIDRGIAREGYPVYWNGKEIGFITSGTQLPHVGYAGAMALLASEAREPGTVVEVDVRGRRLKAEVVKLPFYKRKK